MATQVAPGYSNANGSTNAGDNKETVLVIGSLGSVQDQTYLTLISGLSEQNKKVDKYMTDRIIEGGMFHFYFHLSSRLIPLLFSPPAVDPTPNLYDKVYITLTQNDYISMVDQLPRLFDFISLSLVGSGQLTLQGLPPQSNIHTTLSVSGFTILPGSTDETTTLTAQKVISAPKSIALPKRPTTKSQKVAIWSFSDPSTPTIEPSTLLQPADLARPVPTCEPVTAGTPRRKKACKGCSCGLAELEAEEAKNARVVMLSGGIDGEAVAVTQDEKQRLIEAAAKASKATSSCGSCFLGDAFRCASCPYLGLPAFKPGEKVEIDFGMDDV
jgi:anamorsin